MSQEQKNKVEKDLAQPPIIHYVNRLQKQLYNVSIMLSMNQPIRYSYKPLRILIANLPPQGKKRFVEELKTLTNKNPSEIEIERIFNKIHDWLYENIFEQSFLIKGLYEPKENPFEGEEIQLES